MKSYLEYLEDSIIIEELSKQEFGLKKQAGVLDTLGGVADSIKNTISSQIRGDSASEIGKGLVRLVTPGILFRLHPLVGILYAIGNAIGFDIVDFFEKVWDKISQYLHAGESISTDIVNQVGKGLLASQIGSLESEAYKTFSQLIKEAQVIDYTKELAGLSHGRQVPSIPWLFSKSESPIQRIFGNLLQGGKTNKAKWLLGGFIIWIIKTVLAGAGLLAGAGAIKQLITPKITERSTEEKLEIKPDNKYYPEETRQDTEIEVKYDSRHTTDNLLRSSGRGEQYFENDADTSWVVPLINNSIEDTLLTWVIDIYPTLYSYKENIIKSQDFQNTVDKLQQNWKSASPSKLIMPKNFHSRKQVVDSFINTAIKNIL